MKTVFRFGQMRALVGLGALAVSLALGSCGSSDDIESEEGRSALIEQANAYLNSGMCGQAIDVLTPYYQSAYVDEQVKLILASAYACKAGFSFLTVAEKLRTASTDIWSLLVSAMYSNGNDSHLTYYQKAATLIEETSSVSGSQQARYRSTDANFYMVMIQSGVISSVISVLGAANSSTGKKTQVINAAGATTAQKCAVQVAVSVMNDSISQLTLSTLGTLKSTLSVLCAGGCSNLSLSTCLSTAAYQVEGQAILVGIDATWSL